MDAESTLRNEIYLNDCARMLVKYGHLERAQELYSALLQKNLRNTQALFGLGEVYYLKSEWMKAFKCFMAYSMLGGPSSNKIQGLLWAGAALIKAGKKQEAATLFNKEGGLEQLLLKCIGYEFQIPELLRETLKAA